MKSKLIAIGMAAALAVGCVGVASANPITNGTFSSTTPTHTMPTQFANGSGHCGIGSRTWGGQFVDGWTADQGYAVWYPSASAASGTQACTQYGNTGNQYLPNAVTGAPTGTATFVGLDGQTGIRAAISQELSGLTIGEKYAMSFYWASTQEMSRTGATTERFDVFLDNTRVFHTSTNHIGTHGWSGWTHASFTFTAGAINPTLKFLSVGTPGNLPPFALLSDVTMHAAVPEPPELALFGVGLLGLGVLTVAARRRAQRRARVGGDDDIA